MYILNNTLPISNYRYNKTRKPLLQYNILGCLLLNGKLTRGELEKKLNKNHTDIKKSVRALLTKGLIEILPTCVPSKTKPAECLKINLEGFRYLIQLYNYDETIFWKALIGYVVHQDQKISKDQIRKIIDDFLVHYIEYSYDGTNQIALLNELINDIILNFTKKENTLDDFQKVMETLAVKGGLTLTQLVEFTGCSRSTLQQMLTKFSLEGLQEEYELNSNNMRIVPPINIPIIPEDLIDTGLEVHPGNEKYKSLIIHYLITISEKHRHKENIYELTLYGVIFVLTLIRLFDRDLLQNGLFYNDLHFGDYFDIIVKNYKALLPLIFGKWILLKKESKLLALYNFDIVIDNHLRLLNEKSISILNGGNSELIQGIRQISVQNGNRLFLFSIEGRHMLDPPPNHILPISNIDETKNKADYIIGNEINRNESSLENLNNLSEVIADLSIESMPFEYLTNLDPITGEAINRLSYQKHFSEFMKKQESKCVDEITSLYYLNFYHQNEIIKRFSYPTKFYTKNKNNEMVYPLHHPKKNLERLVELDKCEPFIGKYLERLTFDLWLLIKNVEQTLGKSLGNTG